MSVHANLLLFPRPVLGKKREALDLAADAADKFDEVHVSTAVHHCVTGCDHPRSSPSRSRPPCRCIVTPLALESPHRTSTQSQCAASDAPRPNHHEYVSTPFIQAKTFQSSFSFSHLLPDNAPLENPFASTHSLDENPFNDPTPAATQPSYEQPTVDRTTELDRREAQLRQQEEQLRRDQEQVQNIRRNGKNNWPPCNSSSCLAWVIRL